MRPTHTERDGSSAVATEPRSTTQELFNARTRSLLERRPAAADRPVPGSLVLLLPMARGMVLIMSPFKPAAVDVVRPRDRAEGAHGPGDAGRGPAAWMFLLAAAGALAAAFACLAASVRLRHSEKIVFGR